MRMVQKARQAIYGYISPWTTLPFLAAHSRISHLLEVVRGRARSEMQGTQGTWHPCQGGAFSLYLCIAESTCKDGDLNNQPVPHQASLMGLKTLWPKFPQALQPHKKGLCHREKPRSMVSEYCAWKRSHLEIQCDLSYLQINTLLILSSALQ